ncbi:hypothetical protein F7725_004437 [Dissostichus mawsoni]|uniref:HAUS augmin-like complex subunit 6 N-terminal domain-containing protein n=1 Tax=Dissostichus mawsoni TaxID=36200 RepID=A0A7J5XJF1_DISMA|nr:hypothetical protein F7725_004437 [Dissostichus mawsoni]
MANPALLQKKNGKYLWFALLGLGLQPDKLNLTAKRINLGPHCWPVLCHKADVEFRKVTCAWLREIMEEAANAGSKVVASLFLSPGGPKFVSLMLHLANHVMLQKMKTFTADDCWVPEAAALPASSLDMAVKRMDLIHARFLKAAVIRIVSFRSTRAEHSKSMAAGDNYMLLVRSMRDVRAEGAKYDELLKRHSSDSAQEGASLAEKSRKVRSLWSDIDGMLSPPKRSKMWWKGDVDQYILDGTDQVLKIPRSLLERIEQLPHQLSSGNVYEAGQLNLLSVFELTNHALQLLREECCRVSEAPKPQLSPQQLQVKCQQMARALQNLHLIRQSISKEEIPEVRSAIGELEAAWDRKWMDTLKDTPLVSFLNEDPALGFLSPMAPLSFEPAADASYRSRIFSQYPASLLALWRKCAFISVQLQLFVFKTALNRYQLRSLTVLSSPLQHRHKQTLLWTGSLTPPSPLRKAPAVPPPQAIIASVRKIAHVPQNAAPIRTKTQILDMECDNLADQFAHTLHENIEVQSQKGVSCKSSLLWDTFDTEALDSLSDTGSSAVQFSLDQETLPEMPSYDSLLTPLHENIEVQSQKGVSLKSSLLWDTFDTEALDSLSGTGSSAVQFSLDQETLPEMPSYDSLLSLDDEAVDMTSEDDDDEELLIPSLKTEEKQTPLATHPLGRIQQACSDGSYKQSEDSRVSSDGSHSFRFGQRLADGACEFSGGHSKGLLTGFRHSEDSFPIKEAGV